MPRTENRKSQGFRPPVQSLICIATPNTACLFGFRESGTDRPYIARIAFAKDMVSHAPTSCADARKLVRRESWESSAQSE